MPTISQLPVADSINPTDQIPVSQDGVSRTTSVSALLAEVQPAIRVETSTLLGRRSMGVGGPEEIIVGPGLILEDGTLTTADGLLNSFQVTDTVTPEDRLVIRREGELTVVPASAARHLYAAGRHIAIDNNGTIEAIWPTADDIGAGGSVDISGLPRSQNLRATDLIPIQRGSVTHATTYSTLLNAQTIDEAPPAVSPSDADLVWVAQDGNTMVRQSFAAIWGWINQKLPSARLGVVELGGETTLDATVHNGRVLVCTQPIRISASMQNMGAGFHCKVLNLAAAPVTFGEDILLPYGVSNLPPRRSCEVHFISLSSGSLVFVDTAVPGISAAVPSSVQNLTVSDVTNVSVHLAWVEPMTGAPPFTYTALHRLVGAPAWQSGPIGFIDTTCQINDLIAGSSYEFVIIAENRAGVGNMSAVVSTTTQGAALAPGQPVSLAAATQGSDSIGVSWAAPTSGGTATGYNVQYRSLGASVWTNGPTGVSATSVLVAGLNPGTSYEFRVFAVNAGGVGPASQTATATTQPLAGAVTSIQWNLAPTGPYTHGTGSIGVNVLVTPADAAVRFGFSTSPSIPPSTWTLAAHIMTNIWGAYVDTPATAGTWYAWAQGTDGSASTLYPTSFVVQ